MACFADCAAIRPKFLGVTSVSTHSPRCAVGCALRASSKATSRIGSVARSTTLHDAMARMSKVFRSMVIRKSRACCKLLPDAVRMASSTARMSVSRSRPRSLSRYSNTASSSLFMTAAPTLPMAEKKTKNPIPKGVGSEPTPTGTEHRHVRMRKPTARLGIRQALSPWNLPLHAGLKTLYSHSAE